jgi:F-type H+-transporting ATPase subunit b
VHLFAALSEVARSAVVLTAASEPAGGFTINFFWVIVAALNFLVFFALAWIIILKPLSGRLAERRAAIDQGLKDAEAARVALEASAARAADEIAAARREAREIVDRSQRLAQESREADIAATREELERLRIRATAEIEAEKSRAIADLRTEVADLAMAAAGRIVGESMTGERQRRLVEEFLAETSAPDTAS